MIICIGEIVWDIFESREVIGGAPLNVAYHLSTIGQDVQLISKVGRDKYGEEAIQKIEHIGLSLEEIQYDTENQTGKVLVHLNEENEPSFEILSPAAWDFITLPQADKLQNLRPYHLVFGTLAQRSAVSRATIQSLRSFAETVFYDVNLRPPYTPQETVLESLSHANVGKMNEDELIAITSWSSLPPGSLEEMAQAVLHTFHLDVLALTLGGAGALLVCLDGMYRHEGFPVQVADTVGAGDAFFAALIDGITQGRDWQECLVQANRRGAFVASQPGATPDMNTFQRGFKI